MPVASSSAVYFLSAVTELINLGEVAWKQVRERAFQKSFWIKLPLRPEELTPDDIQAWAIRMAFEKGEAAWRPKLGDVFMRDAGGKLIPKLVEDLSLTDRALVLDFGMECGAQGKIDVLMPATRMSSVLLLHDWAQKGDTAPSTWQRLGLGMSRFALSLLAARPDAIGARGRIEAVVTAVASQIVTLLPEDVPTDAASKPFGERALDLFANATMTTLIDRPDLFISNDKLARVAGAMLQPLHEVVKADGSLETPALARLGQLLRGPMAYGVLSALSDDANGVLKGEFGENRILGAVARSVLSEIATTDQKDFDLLHTFGEAGSARLFKAALTTAKSRPELFVRGKSESSVAVRGMFRDMAAKLVDAPKPFDLQGGLGADLTAVALDSAAIYLRGRLIKDAQDEKDWPAAGVKVAAELMGEIFKGFQLGLENRNGYNPFQHLFDRETAVSVVKVIAASVAETPGMIVDDKASPEIRNIASGVARAVAMDTNRLLRAEDWRVIIGVALAEASKNPGVLFGVDVSQKPENHVAVLMISTLLSKAELSMRSAPRQPGKLLFGETLRDALVATLKATASTAATLSQQDVGRRIVSLEAFIDRLQRLAEKGVPGVDANAPKLRMGSSEWLYVYRWYIAHLIDTGDVSRISDESIRDVLLGLAKVEKQGARA